MTKEQMEFMAAMLREIQQLVKESDLDWYPSANRLRNIAIGFEENLKRSIALYNQHTPEKSIAPDKS